MDLRAIAAAVSASILVGVAFAPGPSAAHARGYPRHPRVRCAPSSCAITRPRLRAHDPRRRIPLIFIAEALGASPHANASQQRPQQTFYVDAIAGRNANAGTSPSAAWRTSARVNHGTYVGGDRILYHGGETFPGPLRFGPANVTGTSAQSQLTIGSYGGGQATLAPGRRSAMTITNVAGFHISGLELAGTNMTCRPQQYFGIFFWTRNSSTTLDQGIAIDHVNAHGFCSGIVVASGDDKSLFAHIRVTDSVVHDNGDAGVYTFDPALKNHDIHDVYVARVQAYNNEGTGGIALFGVEGGTVEHSVAHDNGRSGEGGVGIWAFDSNHIKIQYNESYRNLTTGGDGDGFDLDQGVSNSVMQFNYAHDNEGMGFLVCPCAEFYEMHNVVVRYNVSQNDGTNGQPSALYLLGGEPFSNLDIYNNSFYSKIGAGPLIVLQANELPIPEVHVRNNLLSAGAGKPLLEVVEPESAPGLAFQGNDWWPEGNFEVTWGNRQITSLGELRTATGAETLNGVAVGQGSAPALCALGAAGTIYPLAPAQLRAYELRARSPLAGRGLDLKGLFGTEVGSSDFAGDPNSHAGQFDIGADEHHAGDSC